MKPDARCYLLDVPGVYRIRVQGRIEPGRAQDLLRMSGLTSHVRGQPPITTITGSIIDQANLLSVLTELYDLGYALLDVRRLPQEASFETPVVRPA